MDPRIFVIPTDLFFVSDAPIIFGQSRCLAHIQSPKNAGPSRNPALLNQQDGIVRLELHAGTNGEITARQRSFLFNERRVMTNLFVEQVFGTREQHSNHRIAQVQTVIHV